MKKFVLTVFALMVVAGPAFAQSGDISGYADAAGTNCNIGDTLPFAFIDVFFLHKHTSGATAAQFAVTLTGGSTFVYINSTEAPGMLRIGEGNVDMALAYGACLSGDFLIVTVRYLANGQSPACSRVTVTPAPGSPIPGEVAIVDCESPTSNLLVPATGQAIINPDGTCACNVAVSEKTWGGIKALYR